MTQPRKQIISLDDTPYYHCVSRCVRRAFLCGSGKGFNFEHRRGWIAQRLKQLASMFCIDIAAYAVMSNHYHVVLRVDKTLCDDLSRDQVITRWRLLFKGPLIVQRYCAGQSLDVEELRVLDDIVDGWRERLGSISWFMRCLNEHLARLANAEDDCKGRFWEGRFKSQALLDEKAIISCMAYVDLNPIRAGIANTPETSDYTSIQERLGITPSSASPELTEDKTNTMNLAELMAFSGNHKADDTPEHLPFLLTDYFALVDWTGRAIRDDKRGHINRALPPILTRLGFDQKDWLHTCCHIEQHFGRAIGPIAKLNTLCDKAGLKWLHGSRRCRELYNNLAVT